MQTLTIQQVAQQTGLSVHTLRYYERNGLLEPVNRASSGHRRYSAEDISRIEFLTRLRTTGMSIRQMQEFTQLFRERPEAIAERRAILETHEQQVQAHIQELERNLEAIRWKIQYYKGLEEQQQIDATHASSKVTTNDDLVRVDVVTKSGVVGDRYSTPLMSNVNH
ncbi:MULTISPECIES: MerR family transcriptional regulator [unclassified Leptolyngbya]|uniref:MerR family transcriptional regulator n=1 Tax=unclassified Leptolyngbya TaxID=2650499 RepID=UPI00168860A1|nr:MULTISPECIES: MerR family transcriptional regulator [unclassified Leptolyngbya]MBD1909245.1 MerR family transcriptional regulator [Leptolyngbya sp. FACHB-8]MBD2156989.1 MerR family transcriptional regulator [Leptolyngbya sp. FACHB-16]